MPIRFPTTPSIDDGYTFAGRTWIFNGIGWASESFSSASNTFLSPRPVNDYREQIPGIAPMAISVAFIPTEITYI